MDTRTADGRLKPFLLVDERCDVTAIQARFWAEACGATVLMCDRDGRTHQDILPFTPVDARSVVWLESSTSSPVDVLETVNHVQDLFEVPDKALRVITNSPLVAVSLRAEGVRTATPDAIPADFLDPLQA